MTTFIPKVSKLTSRVTRVLGCNPGPMTLQGTNTYIVGTGQRRVLLDTGDSNVPEYIESLSQVLGTENIHLEHIVLTHWHHDHVGGLPEVLRKINNDCTVWKHKRTDSENESAFNEIRLAYLSDGQKIKTEGATLRVVYTPGHTTDHVAVILEEENSLFSGDCILGEGTAVFEDLKDYMKSLQKLFDIRPETIYPGHGPVIEEPNLKIKDYIDHRNQREAQILDLLKNANEKEMTDMDIVQTLYHEIPEHLHTAAAINVTQHLVKLLKEKRVIQKNEGWIVRNVKN